MIEVIELEVWTQPGKNHDPDLGKSITLDALRDLNLKGSVFKGIGYYPDPAHVKNLMAAIGEGEINEIDFVRFCKYKRLNPSVKNEKSAAAYLEYLYGRPLAWLHLPIDEGGDFLIKKILVWAAKNSFTVVHPYLLYCIVGTVMDITTIE